MSFYVLISKNIKLLNKKINELTPNYISLRFNDNFRNFILEIQKVSHRQLFGEKQGIVLKGIEKLKGDELRLLIQVIREKGEFDFIFTFDFEPTDFLFLLRKNKLNPKIFYLQEPSKKNLKEFIEDYFKEKGIKLPKEIIKLLKDNYQDNFDLLMADLEKIALLRNNIKLENLSQILHFKTSVFKIQDFFLDKNWSLFIHHFKKLIFEDRSTDKIETLKIIGLLFNSLVKIYLIKNNKIEKLKVNSFYLQKLKEKAKKLTTQEIKSLIAVLAKTDRKLKKFYISARDIPEDIVFNYLLT